MIASIFVGLVVFLLISLVAMYCLGEWGSKYEGVRRPTARWGRLSLPPVVNGRSQRMARATIMATPRVPR